ncbi:MAG: biotin/lipoyl-containing protein, partial [Gammaproteobacteria bacterium]
FIVGADRSFHFMEMNTRLQVEHPVTEETTGLDLVEWQLRVASGERLPLAQHEIKQHGRAIEVRLYAENAAKGFLPVTGRIESFTAPGQPFARVDTGVRSGDEISIFYDPMIAKISVSGKDRAEAVSRLREVLAHTAVLGLITNLPLLRGIARHPDFAAGRFDTGFIERELTGLLAQPALTPAAVAAAVTSRLAGRDAAAGPWQADGWRVDGSHGQRLLVRGMDGTEQPLRINGGPAGFSLDFHGGQHQVRVSGADRERPRFSLDGEPRAAQVLRHGNEFQVELGSEAFNFVLTSPFTPKAVGHADTATHPVSPMPGRVVAVHVKAGDQVETGQPLLVLEGMKMEYTVKAAMAGRIEAVLCKQGEMVEADAVLVEIKANGA